MRSEAGTRRGALSKIQRTRLIVLGVHSNNGADKLESFLQENEIHFPIVVDAGQTAES